MLVNLNDDLPLIRDFFADRVGAQASVGEPISAIEVCFRLSQGCLVGLNFDTREEHARDGTCYDVWDKAALELPHWNEAYEAAGDEGVSFVLLTGERPEIPATEVDDESVASVFGEALLAITLDAIAAGLFAPLPLRDDCQLDLEEFDGTWGWPNEPFDPEAVNRANEIRRLPPLRLPA